MQSSVVALEIDVDQKRAASFAIVGGRPPPWLVTTIVGMGHRPMAVELERHGVTSARADVALLEATAASARRLARLRAWGSPPGPRIVLWSSAPVRGLSGGDEAIHRGMADAELHARLHNQLQLGRALRTLTRRCVVDELTDVLNRRGIEEALHQACERGRGRPLSALLLDVDDFKAVNDLAGHAAGDRALREIARSTAGAVRCNDYVGRVGGDEFLVVLPGTTARTASAIARRIRRSLSPLSWGDPRRPLTVTVGEATVQGDMVEPGLLLEAADRDMYTRKRLRVR